MMTTRGPIAIVSGLGPLAGADVLWKVLEHTASTYDVREDADYPDVLLASHGIPGFDSTGLILPSFRSELLAIVDALESHHPSVLGIACNTAHLFAQAVKERTRGVFVNIIDETAKVAARSKVEYLLISSSTTRAQGLYHSALLTQGVAFTEVDDDEQLKIDQVIDLVMAFHLQAAGDLLGEVLMSGRHSFGGVIAGCTELPLALERAPDLGALEIVESNRALAGALVDAWAQRAWSAAA